MLSSIWTHLLHQLCKEGFRQLLAEPALASHTPRMKASIRAKLPFPACLGDLSPFSHPQDTQSPLQSLQHPRAWILPSSFMPSMLCAHQGRLKGPASSSLGDSALSLTNPAGVLTGVERLMCQHICIEAGTEMRRS